MECITELMAVSEWFSPTVAAKKLHEKLCSVLWLYIIIYSALFFYCLEKLAEKTSGEESAQDSRRRCGSEWSVDTTLFHNLIILLMVFLNFRTFKKYSHIENNILNEHNIDFYAIKMIQHGTTIIIIIRNMVR